MPVTTEKNCKNVEYFRHQKKKKRTIIKRLNIESNYVIFLKMCKIKMYFEHEPLSASCENQLASRRPRRKNTQKHEISKKINLITSHMYFKYFDRNR